MASDIGRAGFVRQQTAILGRRDQRDTLSSFDAPVLVLCGTSDVLTPPKFSEEMADLAPDVNLKLLDGIGHLSSLEAPGAVTKALSELFCRIESSSNVDELLYTSKKSQQNCKLQSRGVVSPRLRQR